MNEQSKFALLMYLIYYNDHGYHISLEFKKFENGLKKSKLGNLKYGSKVSKFLKKMEEQNFIIPQKEKTPKKDRKPYSFNVEQLVKLIIPFEGFSETRLRILDDILNTFYLIQQYAPKTPKGNPDPGRIIKKILSFEKIDFISYLLFIEESIREIESWRAEFDLQIHLKQLGSGMTALVSTKKTIGEINETSMKSWINLPILDEKEHLEKYFSGLKKHPLENEEYISKLKKNPEFKEKSKQVLNPNSKFYFFEEQQLLASILSQREDIDLNDVNAIYFQKKPISIFNFLGENIFYLFYEERTGEKSKDFTRPIPTIPIKLIKKNQTTENIIHQFLRDYPNLEWIEIKTKGNIVPIKYRIKEEKQDSSFSKLIKKIKKKSKE